MSTTPEAVGRSDDLRVLLQLFEQWPSLHSLAAASPKLRVIVDSNAILGDIRWAANHRRVASARTSLLEVAETGIAAVYAPHSVRHEVLAQADEFEESFGVRRKDFESEWSRYEAAIRWLNPRTVRRKSRDLERRLRRDPSDSPCVVLARQLGAPVLTRDRDYESFGVSFHNPRVTESMRRYGRATAKELQMKGGAAVSLGLTLASIRASINGLRSLPPPLRILTGCVVLALIADPRGRKWLGDFATSLRDFAGDGLCQFATALAEAQSKRREQAIERFTPARPQGLADYIAIAVAESDKPLTTNEVVARVFAGGYRTESSTFAHVVATYLRRDERITRIGIGWRLDSAVRKTA